MVRVRPGVRVRARVRVRLDLPTADVAAGSTHEWHISVAGAGAALV